MVYFIMVADEVEQRMTLARGEMTQSVLNGPLGVVERDDREGRGLWQTVEHSPVHCGSQEDSAPANCRQVGMGIPIARTSNFL